MGRSNVGSLSSEELSILQSGFVYIAIDQNFPQTEGRQPGREEDYGKAAPPSSQVATALRPCTASQAQAQTCHLFVLATHSNSKEDQWLNCALSGSGLCSAGFQ